RAVAWRRRMRDSPVRRSRTRQTPGRQADQFPVDVGTPVQDSTGAARTEATPMGELECRTPPRLVRVARHLRRLSVISALIAAPSGGFANPLGGQVVGGQATIQGQGTKTVTVTQATQNAIINWNTFNIGPGELTQFIQPSASSIALNRVSGGLGPSQI